MKAEDSIKDSKLNVLNFSDKKSQVDAELVQKVILNNGTVLGVVKGSFHFFITTTERPMPFIQFDTHDLSEATAPMRVEVFPTAVAGVAYYAE